MLTPQFCEYVAIHGQYGQEIIFSMRPSTKVQIVVQEVLMMATAYHKDIPKLFYSDEGTTIENQEERGEANG